MESRFEALHGAGVSELVGREEESDLLLRRWSRAKAGEGQVVLLSGEAGIGKSRLTAALLQRIGNEPHIRLRYFCSPQHTNTALYPVIGQLERGAGLTHDDPPKTRLDKLDAMLAQTSTSAEGAQIFAEMMSLPNDGRYPVLELSPQQRRQRTLEALVLQMEALTRSNPVLMIFEDAHWIDPTTQELLVTMVERMIGWRVLLVITARPEFAPPWPNYSHIAVTSLMRLDLREGAKLVDRVAGGLALPVEVTEQILSRADGVPLFLEELTKTVLGGGFLEILNGRYVLSKPLPELAIPTTLHASLMARLDRSELAKEIAQIGAAIGREFSYSLLRAVAAIDDATLKEALGKLEETELASCRGRPPEATYSFRHALVQDTAYSSLLKTRRQEIHRQIAEALRDRFPSLADAEPEIIARHFTAANLPDPAVEWWSKAAEQALRRCAYAEAISHYKKAIAMAEELGEGPQPLRRRLRLQIACGAALISARGHGAPETTAAFTRARELAADLDDAAERFSVYYGLWAGGYVRGEHATMEEIAAIMLREIESRPDAPESVVAYRVIGTTCWSGGDFAKGRQYLEKAVGSLAPESGSALALRFGQDPNVSALVSLGLVLFGLGEIDRARALVEQAMGRAVRSGHMPTLAYGHFYACVLETLSADPARAAPHANASVALGRTHGMPVWVAASSFFSGWTRSCAGDERGIVELRHALALCHERSVLNWLNLMVAVQAAAEADSNNVEDGIAVIDAFVADAQPVKQHWLDAELYRQRGALLLRRTPADPEAAEAEFQRALAIARRQQTKMFELRAAFALAQLWRLQGKRREAIDLLAPVYGRFTEGFDSSDLKQAKVLLEELAS
jgi:predicted ATPase